MQGKEDIAGVYPWQASQWQRFVSQWEQARLPHALIMTGPRGVGKLQFANHIANALLCSDISKKEPCGACKDCKLVIAKHHPDFFYLEPELATKPIKVEQIRALTSSLQQTRQRSTYHVVIIQPADMMNTAASNALLKTLEEPTTNTIFLLVTEKINKLLPTIRSRCQQLQFHYPKADIAIEWLSGRIKKNQQPVLLLELANGAPLQALTLDSESQLTDRRQLMNQLKQLIHVDIPAIDLAHYWQNKDWLVVCDWLMAWSLDMLRIYLVKNTNLLTNSDVKDDLIELCGLLSKSQLSALYKLAATVKSMAFSNANKLLLLEHMFIKIEQLLVDEYVS